MAVKPAGEYKPKELEEEILKQWRESNLAQRSLTEKRGKVFSFLEGPPTANAPPALHHVEVRVFKDLINRFNFMRGRTVPRKAGWDCHGLPVEVQIEKELGLKSKKEILDYGIDKFVEKCRGSVFSHIKEWDKLTERMAYWVDLKSPYITMDNDYIESVWWSLAEIHKKGLLYEGHKVVPYCPRCGTPLSSHEVALGYKTVKEQTIIVSFPVKDKDFSLLAWTTTPWTLLSNLALAVNPDIVYAKIKYRGEQYVLAKNLAQSRFPEADLIEELSGKDLVGLEYTPLFNHFVGKLDKPAWRVIKGDFVTTEEGTGIVHIAPAFGEDDYNVGKENNLPLVNPLDEAGKFTDQIPELAGLFAKDADPKIIMILDERGSIIAKYPYEHEYPFCWRCKSPLLYYAMKSWFIAMTKLRDRLLANNNQINWYPTHIKEGRFGKWLENVKDWSLSRNRFWATPLPIWVCGDCEAEKAIGSRKELNECSVGEVSEELDLHRPYVDEVKLKCSCGGKMTRVPYVIDCWYDSGSAPFAQFHYPFENKEEFEKRFPYDFISEATDQTRGWFYTLLAISTVLFDKPSYLNCVVGGLLLDDSGEKMSKSNNNVVDPWELFNTVGADAVRLQMCSQAPWNARRFGMESLNESVVPFLRTLFSCYEFATRYMTLDEFDPKEHNLANAKLELADEWILSKANKLVLDMEKHVSENNYHLAVEAVTSFVVEDLSRTYIKLIRDRLWLEDNDCKINPSKYSAYMTLTESLRLLCLTLSPIAPFITEEIHTNLVGGESVHQASWPKAGKVNERLNNDMEVAKKIFEAGSSVRQKAGIKLRYPVAKVTVVGAKQVESAATTLSDVVKKQLNTKNVEYAPELSGTTYEAKPDFKVLGPTFGKDAVKVAKAIKENPLDSKKIFEEGESKKLAGFDVTAEMISEIVVNAPKGVEGESFSIGGVSGVVYIDTKRDEKLMREALARELIRNIQELRKKHDLGELDRIQVEYSGGKQVEDMLTEFADTILSEVRADEITSSEGANESVFVFEDERIMISISF